MRPHVVTLDTAEQISAMAWGSVGKLLRYEDLIEPADSHNPEML